MIDNIYLCISIQNLVVDVAIKICWSNKNRFYIRGDCNKVLSVLGKTNVE